MRILECQNFYKNYLDCTTNSLPNLNNANSNSNLQCGNSAHVSNKGILSFFKMLTTYRVIPHILNYFQVSQLIA